MDKLYDSETGAWDRVCLRRFLFVSSDCGSIWVALARLNQTEDSIHTARGGHQYSLCHGPGCFTSADGQTPRC